MFAKNLNQKGQEAYYFTAITLILDIQKSSHNPIPRYVLHKSSKAKSCIITSFHYFSTSLVYPRNIRSILPFLFTDAFILLLMCPNHLGFTFLVSTSIGAIPSFFRATPSFFPINSFLVLLNLVWPHIYQIILISAAQRPWGRRSINKKISQNGQNQDQGRDISAHLKLTIDEKVTKMMLMCYTSGVYLTSRNQLVFLLIAQ